jgi:aspartyl/asparaginyl beta-hydroxylase (cupin superfamily)
MTIPIFENGFKECKNNLSFNHKDRYGIVIVILFVILFLCFALMIKPFSINRKYIIILISILTLIFVVAYFMNPALYMYAVSSIITLNVKNPPFIDKREYFSNYHMIEDNYEIIKEELDGIIGRQNSIPAAGDTFGGRNEYIGNDRTTEDNKWRIYLVSAGNKPTPAAQQECPKTVEILSKLPEIKSFVFSILEPGVKIPIHVGYYKGILRYMLGMKIPKDRENVFLWVNGIKKHWEEGEGFLWDDTYPHQVYNDTDETRIIVYADIERPLTGILKNINTTMLQLMAGSKTVQDEVKKTEVPVSIK